MRTTGPLDFSYSHARCSAVPFAPIEAQIFQTSVLRALGESRQDLSQIPRYQLSEERLRGEGNDEASRKKEIERPPGNRSRGEALPFVA